MIRANSELLRSGRIRDGKTSPSAAGKQSIHWLVENGDLPVNLVSTLSKDVRDRIFGPKSGQSRINEVFRLVQGRIISLNAIETVARQKGSMKRVRDARKMLRSEGIVVLGHQEDHPMKALQHDLPVPKKGEFFFTSRRWRDWGRNAVRFEQPTLLGLRHSERFLERHRKHLDRNVGRDGATLTRRTCARPRSATGVCREWG